MKKRIVGGLAIIMIGIVAAFHLHMNAEINNLSALSLANIEALADESSEGISTSDCYEKKHINEKDGTGMKYLPCPSNTTSNNLEKCPADNEWIEGNLIYPHTLLKCHK